MKYIPWYAAWFQHALSRVVGWVMYCKQTQIKRLLIKLIVRKYKINMEEVLEPDINNYQHFNDFFTRRLKPDARPIVSEPDAVACPADGCVSEIGHIEQGRLLQAKGMDYSAQTLLGGDSQRAAPFKNGQFACFYLSPKDYHRVHMPLSGELKEMIHVPGNLFSVSTRSAQKVPQLFARNERVVSIFETESGPMAVVMVGAMLVASISTAWAGIVAPPHLSRGKIVVEKTTPICLQRGEEMGSFQFGSTVIVLFGQEKVTWSEKLNSGSIVKMGERIGKTHDLRDITYTQRQHQQTIES